MSEEAIQSGAGPVPHRGELILILGISGFILGYLFGIIAWSLGTKDLRKMADDEMDDSGWTDTQLGVTLGKISTIVGVVLTLPLLTVLFYALIIAAG